MLVHRTEAAGDEVVFDPPVVFVDCTEVAGHSVETASGGYSFTSNFQGEEACPNLWTTDEWTCIRVEVDDGDGDDMAGAPFAGTWWITKKWGTSR